MLLDGLGWSHYSVFAPCIMTQTRILGRSGVGAQSSSRGEVYQRYYKSTG